MNSDLCRTHSVARIAPYRLILLFGSRLRSFLCLLSFPATFSEITTLFDRGVGHSFCMRRGQPQPRSQTELLKVTFEDESGGSTLQCIFSSFSSAGVTGMAAPMCVLCDAAPAEVSQAHKTIAANGFAGRCTARNAAWTCAWSTAATRTCTPLRRVRLITPGTLRKTDKLFGAVKNHVRTPLAGAAAAAPSASPVPPSPSPPPQVRHRPGHLSPSFIMSRTHRRLSPSRSPLPFRRPSPAPQRRRPAANLPLRRMRPQRPLSHRFARLANIISRPFRC